MAQSHVIEWDYEKISLMFRAPAGAKGLLLMAHGGPGGSKYGPANLFDLLEARFNSIGYATCRFDFRGSGESSGVFGDVTLCSLKDDLLRVKRWCTEKLDVPIILLGESLGATVALMALSDYRAPVALLWPAIDLRDTSFRSFMTPEVLDRLTEDGWVTEENSKISHRFLDECMTLDLWPKIGLLKGKYFIAHGGEDHDVPCSQSDRLAETLGSRCEYMKFPRSGHGVKISDDRQKMVIGLLEWATKL